MNVENIACDNKFIDGKFINRLMCSGQIENTLQLFIQFAIMSTYFKNMLFTGQVITCSSQNNKTSNRNKCIFSKIQFVYQFIDIVVNE